MKFSASQFARVLGVIVVVFFFEKNIAFSQSKTQVALPAPDHIVILILENHGYSEIIGSSHGPYINALANDQHSALFTNSYAVEHPSQPNYLDLYAGCNQGVLDDAIPTKLPFTTANLGRQLIDVGKTFITYSEDLPSVGYNGGSSGNYARKHNPAANWMGTGVNQIPTTTNQPMAAFPTDFTLLPTVSYVVPNQKNDMHDGSYPANLTLCDTWVYNNLNNYIEWAKTHNSLFILTFDEDDYIAANRIATIFTGQMVKPGQYPESINHYSLLRTIEDMYGLPYACNASTASSISDCWSAASAVKRNDPISAGKVFTLYPNPSSGDVTIRIDQEKISTSDRVRVFNILGEQVFEKSIGTSKEIAVKNLQKGSYRVQINAGDKIFVETLIVE